MTYETLEDAFYFVSSAAPGEHVAVLSLKTGEIFFASDLLGHDGLPDDLEESDCYLDIPHMMELLPVKELVIRFVSLRCFEEMERVERILARPGGLSRYKRFLQGKGLLEEWYLFQMDRVGDVLRAWCMVKGIPVAEKCGPE